MKDVMIDIQKVLDIYKLRDKYGDERIAFLHFRYFKELCDYILENNIENENVLSKDVKERLLDYYTTFVKKHS